MFYRILVKGGMCIKHTCWQRLAASHEEQMPPLMILVLFLDTKRCKNWAHKIFS